MKQSNFESLFETVALATTSSYPNPASFVRAPWPFVLPETGLCFHHIQALPVLWLNAAAMKGIGVLLLLFHVAASAQVSVSFSAPSTASASCLLAQPLPAPLLILSPAGAHVACWKSKVSEIGEVMTVSLLDSSPLVFEASQAASEGATCATSLSNGYFEFSTSISKITVLLSSGCMWTWDGPFEMDLVTTRSAQELLLPYMASGSELVPSLRNVQSNPNYDDWVMLVNSVKALQHQPSLKASLQSVQAHGCSCDKRQSCAGMQHLLLIATCTGNERTVLSASLWFLSAVAFVYMLLLLPSVLLELSNRGCISCCPRRVLRLHGKEDRYSVRWFMRYLGCDARKHLQLRCKTPASPMAPPQFAASQAQGQAGPARSAFYMSQGSPITQRASRIPSSSRPVLPRVAPVTLCASPMPVPFQPVREDAHIQVVVPCWVDDEDENPVLSDTFVILVGNPMA